MVAGSSPARSAKNCVNPIVDRVVQTLNLTDDSPIVGLNPTWRTNGFCSASGSTVVNQKSVGETQIIKQNEWVQVPPEPPKKYECSTMVV